MKDLRNMKDALIRIDGPQIEITDKPTLEIREYGSTLYVGLAVPYHPLIQTSG